MSSSVKREIVRVFLYVRDHLSSVIMVETLNPNRLVGILNYSVLVMVYDILFIVF